LNYAYPETEFSVTDASELDHWIGDDKNLDDNYEDLSCFNSGRVQLLYIGRQAMAVPEHKTGQCT